MSKLTVALDCDGVLFSCNDYVRDLAERVLHREMPPPSEHMHFEFDKALGLSRYEWSLVQNKILGGTGTLDMPWLPGAEDFVRELMAKRDVFFLTSHWRDCPRWVMDREWRLTNAFGPVDVVFAHNKMRCQFDYLIDDKVQNIEAAGEKGLLFSQPWNRAATHLDGQRFTSYEQLLTSLESK